MGNDDHSRFLRRDGDEWVMMEHDGPGVLTRLWFTGREDGSRDQSYLDTAVLHLYVDGREISFGDGERGVPIGTLAGGGLAGFPRPWVADREVASGALLAFMPIPFQSSVRVSVSDIDLDGRSLYYQIDWRELPAGCVVGSFDGTLDDVSRDALAAAEQIWFRHERSCGSIDARTVELAGSDAAFLDVAGPTIVRSIRAAGASVRAFDTVLATLEVDGVASEETPLSRLLAASYPAEPSRAVLSSLDTSSAELRYPAPVRERMRLGLRLAPGAAPATVELTLCHDPGPVPAELGSLRVECGEVVSAEIGQNVTLLHASGAGHFAGQFLVTDGPHPNFWFLEGDHELVEDGAYTILGTGLEDYFGGAFYYQLGPSALGLSGASGRMSADDRSMVSQYRHHLLDTIPFETSFRFEYESFVQGTRFEHCSFWYEHAR